MNIQYEIAFAGLFAALMITELTGIYPGGIIVPAYLVLYFEQPVRIAGTLAVAFLALGIYRICARHLLLFGRRRLVFIIFLSGIIIFSVYRFMPALFPSTPEFKIIGWVVPGIIAHNFDRQGIGKTLASLIIAICAAYFLGMFLLQIT